MSRLFKNVALALMMGGVVSGSALAQGDAAVGKDIFRRCAMCHSLEAGKTKVGPSLHGVLGREAGSLPGFRYSPAMKAADLVWSEETLDRYLAAPEKVVPGNRMPFPGLDDADARADLIAYLKQVLGTP